MEFLLLGPLEVRRDGIPLLLGPRRAQRSLLGLLLLEVGRMIPTDRLADLLWDDDPPDNARAIIQTHISRLRTELDPHRDGRDGVRLVWQKTGYELHANPGAIDASRFRAMVSDAEAIGDPAARAHALRQALALWRGPILADAASDRLRERVGSGLIEMRLHAWEACFDAELEAGQHRKVIPELNDLVAENPLRERLTYLLMSALFRDGRQTAALEAFQAAQERIAEATGLDPGPQLQDLRTAILRGDALPPATPSRTVVKPAERDAPRQLPPDIAHFVARSRELSDVVRIATAGRGEFPGAVAIHGPGGIGKSALAIHAAHRLSRLFPDGQLYLDLQGSTPGLAPLTVLEALRRLLRSQGIDSRDIPQTVAECATMLRQATSGLRVLFLLDNATDAAQVRPLLPAAPTCFVLITSRAILSTLDNTAQLGLETLTEPEAIALLGRFDAEALSAAEHESAAAIVQRCGRLPLAIRVVGARLAAEPHQGLRRVAERLAQERNRLGELELDDLSVRVSISVSHQQLQADGFGSTAAKLLQGMAILSCPDVTGPLAIALTELSQQTVSRALERLREQQLLFHTPGDRYRSHDLIRLFYRELAVAEMPADDRQSALHRALDFYMLNATRAVGFLFAGSMFLSDYTSERPVYAAISDAGDAHDWINRELANIVALVAQGAEAPEAHGRLVVGLVNALSTALYDRFSAFTELRELCETAISVAQQISDRLGEARAHDGLAVALYGMSDPERAKAAGRRALLLCREVSDRPGEAHAQLSLGFIHRATGDFAAAIAHFGEGITTSMEAGFRTLEANLRDNLGTVYQQLGRFDEAIESHLLGLRIRREVSFELGIAASLENLGWALLGAGRPREALANFHESAELCAKISNFMLRAGALWGVGAAEHALGHGSAARKARMECIDILRHLSAIQDDEVALILAQEAPEMPSALRKLSE